MKCWTLIPLFMALAGCSTDVFAGTDGGDPEEDAQGDAPINNGDGAMTGDVGDGGVANPDGSDSSFDAGLDAITIDAGSDVKSADASEGGSDAAVICSSVDVSACSHSPCVTGAALPSGCDSSGEDIVSVVCIYSSSCCSTAWSSSCVTLAASLEPKCSSCI